MYSSFIALMLSILSADAGFIHVDQFLCSQIFVGLFVAYNSVVHCQAEAWGAVDFDKICAVMKAKARSYVGN